MVVVLSALAMVFLAAPVLWLTIDEAAVPPASDAPSLPDGVRAADQEVNCASGGCWREWRLSGPQTQSAAGVRDSLGISHEDCAPRGLLDRREVCTWLNVVDGEVRLYLQFKRPLQ